MNEKSIRLVTAESVRAGHPDKLCDQIADATLDAYLEQDPKAKVAVEVLATKNAIAIVGEVTSTGKVDFNEILVDAFNRIGYKAEDLGMKPGKPIKTAFLVHEQSPDIAAAVDKNQEIGAGDQGIMVGYATDETHECMPLPVVLAHQICKRLDKLKRNYSWMGADGKAQVTVVYGNKVISKDNFRVVPNCIDVSRFQFSQENRDVVRQEHGIAADDFVIGHVGRFHPVKNHKFLLEIFAEICKEKHNAKLLLIGDGELLEDIQSYCANLGVADKVIFTGSQRDTAPYYSAMDAFVFPSLWEGVPVSVVEAQAAGVHCYVSDQVTKDVGISELVHYLSIDQGISCWVNIRTFVSDRISVREEAALDILRKMGVNDAVVLLDPTLILDPQKWLGIEKKPDFSVPEGYVLIYMLGSAEKEKAKKYAEDHGLIPIDLGDQSQYDYYATGPEHFVYLIHNATAVFTDSFHAMVFSIIFKRELHIYYRQGMTSRIETLFRKVQREYALETRVLKDYEGIDVLLEKERKAALEFLRRTLSC